MSVAHALAYPLITPKLQEFSVGGGTCYAWAEGWV